MRQFKKIFWLLKAFAANCWYGFPSKKLIVIGVTGTDGKTTTTSLIYHILHTLGKKAAYATTVGARIGDTDYELGFHVTTPRFFQMQKFFSKAVKAGAKYFVLETTSHAIYQLRTWGVKFHIGVLTNITPEHLDYHRDFMDYARTKLRLINAADIAVVNKEVDTYYRYEKLITNKRLWTCAINKKAEYQYNELIKLGVSKKFVSFEKDDVLLAYATARILGFKEKDIVEAINSFERVQGRFDYFEKEGRQFLIDFAHTPNAYKRLFEAIDTIPHKRIIHVFGCAGLRDKIKRPVMGDISALNSDYIVLTEEDYRTEPIDTIFASIEKGIKKHKKHVLGETYFFVPNRQEAVNKAISIAKKGDLIVLTGKAHEKSLARGTAEDPWNEYDAVSQGLKTIT